MRIRRAVEKDIFKILDLLSQVLEVHADLRPDIFISGTTKYNTAELCEMFRDDTRPVFVAVDEDDAVMGYVFCELREPTDSNNMIPHRTLYIDDLCVDSSARGQHVGQRLFEFSKEEAERLGCYDINLNVWAGNAGAEMFYEKMGLTPKYTCLEYVL